MFKEKLHNDIDKITPSAELLDRVSLMMKEEASKEKPKIYMTAAKYGSLAAAVCIVTAVAVMLGTTANKDTAPRTGDLSADYSEAVSDMNMMSFRAETEAGTEAETEMPVALEAKITEAAMQADAADEAAPSEGGCVGIAPDAYAGEAEMADGAAAREEYEPSEELTVSEGYILPCENGSYLFINDAMGPVVLNPENNDNSVFENLSAGDSVRVTHGLILTIYPGQTTLFSIEKLSEGELSDIPEDTLKQLEELGWLPITE